VTQRSGSISLLFRRDLVCVGTRLRSLAIALVITLGVNVPIDNAIARLAATLWWREDAAPPV
jgi:hypothetical protein